VFSTSTRTPPLVASDSDNWDDAGLIAGWRALPDPTAEAARRIGVSRERVRQLLEGGTLAGCRIEGGDRVRFVDLSGEGSESDRVLVTVQEAAQRYGVSAATIRAWIERGRLEGFHIEGERRVYVALE